MSHLLQIYLEIVYPVIRRNRAQFDWRGPRAGAETFLVGGGCQGGSFGGGRKLPLRKTLEMAISKAPGVIHGMASKKTITADNLAALGADRLAAILVELADDNADVKRRLRLELAAQMGGETIAAEIGRRITALRSARSFLDSQKQRELVKDPDPQRAMIVDRVAETRADLALDLMRRFMDLAEPVFNRVDDSSAAVESVFQFACEDLGTIAIRAKPDAVSLADRVFAAVMANDYGVFDDLVTTMLAALGDAARNA